MVKFTFIDAKFYFWITQILVLSFEFFTFDNVLFLTRRFMRAVIIHVQSVI